MNLKARYGVSPKSHKLFLEKIYSRQLKHASRVCYLLSVFSIAFFTFSLRQTFAIRRDRIIYHRKLNQKKQINLDWTTIDSILESWLIDRLGCNQTLFPTWSREVSLMLGRSRELWAALFPTNRQQTTKLTNVSSWVKCIPAEHV